MPSFTITPAKITTQDNPVTYTSTDTDEDVGPDHLEHKENTISDNTAAATLDQCNNNNDNDKESSTSTSSDEAEDDVPQSKADILAAAGVSVNLEELQTLQAEEAPLELVTEVRHTLRAGVYMAVQCAWITLWVSFSS